MDLLTFLLITSPLPIAVGVVTGAVRHLRVRRMTRMQELAATLGLTAVGMQVLGSRNGVKVGLVVHETTPRHGGYIQLHARFEPPLDLGLCVHEAGETPPKFGQGSQELTFRSNFGDKFRVVADDAERARLLFRNAIFDAMLAMRGLGNVLVSDAGITVTAPSKSTASALDEQLDQLVSLAVAINVTREHTPPACALTRHRDGWQAYARRSGLSLLNTPLCVFGSVGDATMYAYSVRVARDRYELEIWLRLEQPLQLGLLVQPTRVVDRMRNLFGEQDILLGDALFDTRFTVRASDIDGARALLDPDVRQLLMSLHRTLGPLTMADDGVSTRMPHVPVTPLVVPQALSELSRLAALIEQKRAGPRRGPYR